MKPLNKWQQEIIQLGVEADSQTAKQLQRMYSKTLREVRQKLKAYDADAPYWQQLRYGQLAQLQQEITELLQASGLEVEEFVFDKLAEEYERGYDELFYLAEQQLGNPFNFNLTPHGVILQLAEQPLAGETLSQRLWKNRQTVVKQVNHILTTGITQGTSTGKLAQEIAQAISSDYHKSLRIARTESHRLHSLAQVASEQEAIRLEIRAKKRWVSALDSRTRSSHRHLDGQQISLDGYFTSRTGFRTKGPGLFGIASEDINCRCVSIVVIEDYNPKTRRDGDGKNIRYKNYKQWKRKRDKQAA